MKWISSAHKATQRVLVSQQYLLLRVGSCPRYFHASNTIGWSKSYQIQASSLFSGRYYSISANQNVTKSSSYSFCRLPYAYNKLGNSIKNVDLEIISRESIKPASPTPHHLRTFNLSIIDQYMFDVYTPLILFLPNTDNTSVTNVVTKRSKHLKEALSKILTQFYPLAGRVKENLHIECNDEGVYYSEARVNQKLKDFLCHPDDEKVRELMPESPCIAESLLGNYVIRIQVNFFLCGGIGISTSVSHKIFDGHTFHMFMKAWAAAARGSQDILSPNFVASEIFPNNPHLEHPSPSKIMATKTLSTKRFVFDSTTLAFLKNQLIVMPSSGHPPTRMEATTAVIWKAVAKAASKVRPFGPQSPHALFSAVNLRKRASPPLPKDSIGNLIDGAGAICFPKRELHLPTLIGELRESIAKINSDHIESMKGEKGHEILRKLKQPMDVTREGDCIMASSMLNSGMYNLDFGWGKPVWFYIMNAGFDRFLALNETLKGGGVEAIVTLSLEEMEIFERDPELLSYATVNPSPLRFLKH
ncbi:putative vinorine synthase [Helianthus annuus]|nr:putative vinorine synthase [Helianthus annuus]